jgi:hypothetical protein
VNISRVNERRCNGSDKQSHEYGFSFFVHDERFCFGLLLLERSGSASSKLW